LKAFGPKAVADETVPIACSLSSGDMSQRLEDWRQVTVLVVRREQLDGGIRLIFGDPPPVGELARPAAAEYACCGFFGFALTLDARGPALEVTAPPDRAETLTAVFGRAD
jgi:hypothetical protein